MLTTALGRAGTSGRDHVPGLARLTTCRATRLGWAAGRQAGQSSAAGALGAVVGTISTFLSARRKQRTGVVPLFIEEGSSRERLRASSKRALRQRLQEFGSLDLQAAVSRRPQGDPLCGSQVFDW